jgi:hypothetical protein
MKTSAIAWARWVAIVVASLAWPLSLEAATKLQKARAAAELVNETLRREATEELDDRAELLKPAIGQTPACEAAYWQSGFIYDARRKKWLTVEEVQEQSAKDDRLAAYLKIRAKHEETANSQADMARWCTRRRLEDQSRAHWTNVLNRAPDNAEARRQLGYQPVNGAWISQEEITKSKTQADNTQASLERWVPKIGEMLKKMDSSNRRAGDSARDELNAVKDPDAVPAIAALLCTEDEETALFGIGLIKKIQSPQSAAVLAWHAVFAPWPRVAQAAATALRTQDKYDYIPMMLDAAQALEGAKMRFGGDDPSRLSQSSQPPAPKLRMMYRLDSDVSSYSWTTMERLKEHPRWNDIPNMRFNARTPDPVAKHSSQTVQKPGVSSNIKTREYFIVRNDRLQTRITENTGVVTRQRLVPIGVYEDPRTMESQTSRQQMERERARLETISRVNALNNALSEATGEKGLHSPPEWWNWWYDYNEVYTPSGSLKKAAARTDVQSITGGEIESEAQRGDCLAGDTPVRMETGLSPIKRIVVGDRIFCCESETGRLVLKPVLRVTVRPAGPLLKIRVAGKSLEASGGQVFWVAGRGWVKARDLREGMRLHTVSGTVPVEGVEPGSSQTTYGLVTADFHTFFAGDKMILTHDNTIRKPTNQKVPGLAERRAAASH